MDLMQSIEEIVALLNNVNLTTEAWLCCLHMKIIPFMEAKRSVMSDTLILEN